MLVGAAAVGLVVQPFPEVEAAVLVNQAAISVCLVVFPEAFVFSSILPDLGALALAKAVLCPLTKVYSAIIKLNRPTIDEILELLIFLIVFESTEPLFDPASAIIRIIRHALDLFAESTLAEIDSPPRAAFALAPARQHGSIEAHNIFDQAQALADPVAPEHSLHLYDFCLETVPLDTCNEPFLDPLIEVLLNSRPS